MGSKYVRIPEPVREDIIRRIRAGEFRCDIARACKVSEFSVTKIATFNKLQVAKCPRGSRWGKFKPTATATQPTEINWRAVKAALRWNCRGTMAHE